MPKIKNKLYYKEEKEIYTGEMGNMLSASTKKQIKCIINNLNNFLKEIKIDKDFFELPFPSDTKYIFLNTDDKKEKLTLYKTREPKDFDQEDVLIKYIQKKVDPKIKVLKPGSLQQMVKNLSIIYYHNFNKKVNLLNDNQWCSFKNIYEICLQISFDFYGFQAIGETDLIEQENVNKIENYLVKNLDNALGLLYAIDWTICKVFILRNNENAKIDLIDFEYVSSEKRVWHEITSKTRKPIKITANVKKMKVIPLIRNNEDPLDLINLITKLNHHRNKDLKWKGQNFTKIKGKLYLKPFKKIDYNDPNAIWFSSEAYSEEEIRKFIESYSLESCNTVYTSHTKKKFSINKLYDNQFDDKSIMERSGNSFQSLNNYYKKSKKHEEMQNILMSNEEFLEESNSKNIDNEKVKESNIEPIKESNIESVKESIIVETNFMQNLKIPDNFKGNLIICNNNYMVHKNDYNN
jgi:hypothetical protein